MVSFNIMKVCNLLLQTEEPLQNGCMEEVEIRGCSIEAVERIKEGVCELIASNNVSVQCNSILIDHFLWTYRRDNSEDLNKIPFHKVISIYY